MADQASQASEQEENMDGSMMYYIIGGLVVVAIAAGVWFLRPQGGTALTGFGTPLLPTPTPGPITALSCEKQYYNPVVGFTDYYIGLDGVDVPATKSVICEFTISMGGTILSTESAKASFVAAPERNGQVFTCRTKKLSLTPELNTDVTVKITNDLGLTNTCSTTYVLPKP